jgi:quercetin dioxygenase-like cupin family protein
LGWGSYPLLIFLLHEGGGSCPSYLQRFGIIATVGRFTLQPGWKWSQHVKPVVKTQLCESTHFAYHISGRLRVRMSDGTEQEIGPGEVSLVPPGHDAWVVGNEPVVLIDWSGAATYAKR